MNRPRLAITMGDVAGIGPEVIARALESQSPAERAGSLVVGDPAVMDRAFRLISSPLRAAPVFVPTLNADPDDWIPVWNPSDADVGSVAPGSNDARAGAAAYDWLVAAARAALAGQVDAVVTAPLSKAALHRAGRKYPGHTEILAEVCGVHDFAMMLYLPPGEPVRGPHGLGVSHVTLHTSIRSVPGLLSVAAIREKIGLVDRFLRQVGCESPRVGVCALNPHAGEEGLFGDEESRLIRPAVDDARRAGLDASGPFPADTLLQRAVGGEFDGVVAMYHDQGHIALKLIGFRKAVNVTLGLPIVRTSPSHGTAFDIAWKGIAQADGMLAAIQVAERLCRQVPPAQPQGPTGLAPVVK